MAKLAGQLTFSQRMRKRIRDREYQRKRRAALKAAKLPGGIGPTRATPAATLTNRIAIVVDASGSMNHLRGTVVEQLNAQIYNIRKNAYDSGQRTFVSVYTFNRRLNLNVLVKDAHPEAVKTFTSYDYWPQGQTALIDAIFDVSGYLERSGTRDDSNLLIVITDGEENDSGISRSALQNRIAQLNGTDRWTFVALMPPGASHYAISLGIPAGNVREWEGTRHGLEQASLHTVASTSAYYATRASGHTKTASFFTDLSSIGQKDLNKLDDLQGQFKRYPVKAEADISRFVEQQGRPYEVGKAYYQLTKPEKIQSHKDFVIEDRTTKHLYGGDQARKLLGIASGPGVTVRVRPGNHANYNLFVQSTSMNRKLVRGTTLLYKI